MEEYEKGCNHLKLDDYEPSEVSDELFFKLAENDDAFSDIVIDIHNKNKIITKKELKKESIL